MSAGGEAVRHEKPASTRLFLAVVASGVFVTVITATMINVLIPLMRAEFGASAAHVGWVVTGYALAYAISVPLYGRISDFFGVRRVFSVGFLGFAAGGLICSFAPRATPPEARQRLSAAAPASGCIPSPLRNARSRGPCPGRRR